MLKLYSIWHLNLGYSSIEEQQHLEVIRKCYWPLLRLASEHQIPTGIEMPAWTLNKILNLDYLWVEELKKQIKFGMAEVIGSGWTQLIGPVVPAAVIKKNLMLGQEYYRKVLDVEPKIALVNEQAWSASLVPVYKNAGFSAVVMEWENPASIHPEWPRTFKYFPQNVKGGEHTIPLLWNHSIAFQKMQRLAHGDISIEQWSDWIINQNHAIEPRSLCIYGGDAETFNFRPGRYRTEEKILADEWKIIFKGMNGLPKENISFVLPSDVLKQNISSEPLSLESVAFPVPVKKQPKYNIVRWACGGRDAPGINSKCFKIYNAIKLSQSRVDDEDWRTLCELWSSDYRTHITKNRWDNYKKKLDEFMMKWIKKRKIIRQTNNIETKKFSVERSGNFLRVTSKYIDVRLNLRRGMAIDKLKFPSKFDEWLIGSIYHGYFDDPSWSADFYTWETVLELPGKAKVTDLESCDPEISELDGVIIISALIVTILGPIKKVITIDSSENPNITLKLTFLWNEIPAGSLRMGDLILNPNYFDRNTLYVKTHLGGLEPEIHKYSDGLYIQHGEPWSSLVSSKYCLGVTEGILEFGDSSRRLMVNQDLNCGHAPAMITCRNISDSYIFRIQFTARELDDTSSAHPISLDSGGRTYQFSLSIAD